MAKVLEATIQAHRTARRIKQARASAVEILPSERARRPDTTSAQTAAVTRNGTEGESILRFLSRCLTSSALHRSYRECCGCALVDAPCAGMGAAAWAGLRLCGKELANRRPGNWRDQAAALLPPDRRDRLCGSRRPIAECELPTSGQAQSDLRFRGAEPRGWRSCSPATVRRRRRGAARGASRRMAAGRPATWPARRRGRGLRSWRAPRGSRTTRSPA